MNKILCIVLIALIGFSSCAPTKESTSSLGSRSTLTSDFRVLTVNLNHSIRDRSEIKNIASWIRTMSVDVVAVQQIERPTETRPGFDAAAELAKELEMNFSFAKARYYQGFDSGNAILSIYPVRQTMAQQLPVSKGKVRRSMAYGVVDVGLKNVGIVSTELDEEAGFDRAKQVQEIMNVSKTISDFPMVVCGDFNEAYDGKAVAQLSERFVPASTINAGVQSMDQQIYSQRNANLKPTDVRPISLKEKGISGVVVTFQVSQ